MITRRPLTKPTNGASLCLRGPTDPSCFRKMPLFWAPPTCLIPRGSALPSPRILPSSSRAEGRDDRNELDRYAEMDEQKARDLIQVCVAHHAALVPTIMSNFPAYPRHCP